MNRAQAQASGTKPGQLSSPIPGENEQQSSEAGAQDELSQLAKTTKKQPAQEQPQGPSEQEQLAALSEGGQQPTDQQDNFDPMQMYANANTPLPGVGAPSKDQIKSGLADVVQQGIPTAVSMAGTVVGAAAGSAIPGAGTAAGAQGGHALSAGLNVALAPYYRDIANKLREHLGVPKSEESDLDTRLDMALNETIAAVIPGVMNAGKNVIDRVGAKLASEEAERTAQNIAAAQVAKNNGIPVDTTQVFKGTQFDPNVMAMKAKPNLSNVRLRFNDFKNAIGSDVDEKGNLIIRPENIEERTRFTGKQIEDLRNLSLQHDDGQLYDPAPILKGFKEALEVHGIKTENGEVPPSVIDKLDNDAKRVARQYNDLVERVQKVHAENGTTLSVEQLKALREPTETPPNFNGTPDQNAGAQFQDAIPGQPMNIGAPMEVSSASNPIGGQTVAIPQQGVQGSLGLAEQSDKLNSVVAMDKSGNPVTRAQLLAQTSHIPMHSSEGILNRGLSLNEIYDLTGRFQELSNFDSMNRQLSEKQFGSISRTARTMRDEITKSVFEKASTNAEASGNQALADHLSTSSERLKNLSSQFGDLKDVGDKLIKAINNDPVKTTESIIRGLDMPEYKAALRAFSEKEIGALKNAYVRNLIDDSSKGRVLLNPEKIADTIYKDRDRVEMLFGKEHYQNLMDLVDSAKTAAKIDEKYAGGKSVPEYIVNKIAGLVGKISGPQGVDLVENLFLRSPNIRDAVKEAPAYISAFNKYYGGKSAAEKVAQSSELISPILKTRAATGAAQTANEIGKGNERLKKQDEQLKMLDLENK